MVIKNLTRRFNTGASTQKTSLYLHDPIIEALNKLKEKTGDSISDLVAEALDDYLTHLVELGHLEPPTTPQKDSSLILTKSDSTEGA